MKVLDNLENYDIPKEYHLDAEQEDELARIIKEVVDALIPIRGNKRETRKYFSQHLRYSSNLNEQMKEPDYPEFEYEIGQHYKPKEGEFIWDSNLLHPVLISLLKQDRQAFGYILNFLNDDMILRNGEQNWFWRPVSDNAVKYALKFDIEEIRSKVQSLSSYKEKLDYLNQVKCDVELFDSLDRGEYDEFGQAFEYRLDKLTESVKNEKEIWGEKVQPVKDSKEIEHESSGQIEITLTPHRSEGVKLSADDVVLSDVYFSPEVMCTGQYGNLDCELNCNEQVRQQPHIQEFEKVLQSFYEDCYIEDNGVFQNQDIVAKSTKLVNQLFEDYTNRMEELFENDTDTIRRRITEWLRVTVKSITRIHSKNSVFHPKDDIDENTGYPKGSEYSTSFLRDALLEQAYESYLKIGFQYFGPVDKALKNVMPYNLWGGKYDQDFEENFGRVALSDENRAKVFRKANIHWLSNEIESKYHTYDFDLSFDLPFGDPTTPRFDPDRYFQKFLQSLFEDYVRRVNNTTNNQGIAHNSFQIWVFDTMCLLNSLYQEECNRLDDCNYDTEKSLSNCQYFYVGCSMPILVKMLLNYYSDYEEVAQIGRQNQEEPETIEEHIVAQTSTSPHSADSIQEGVSTHKDVLGEALCYRHKDDFLFNQLLQLMLRATEDSAPTLSRELINETFDVISGEFSHYLECTDIFTEDRINVLFMCFDHWFDTFKNLADGVFSACQQSLRPKSRKKSDAEIAKVKEKKAQSMAMFIIEKAIVTVSNYKANILYNHQYFGQVFYNINGWDKEGILAEMERLEDAFGAGRERDILFDKDSNIKAFYEELVDIVRKGLLEVHSTADTMDEEERLETYHSLMQGLIDFNLPMYLDLVKMERDFSTETYHSAVSWVETTKYCLYQVLIEAERRIAEDEDLCVEIDYTFFQKANFTFIPNMFAEALVKYESQTGDFEIDEKLNHLGERDEDDWNCEIPKFDASLLGEDFITDDDLGGIVTSEDDRNEEAREKPKSKLTIAIVKSANSVVPVSGVSCTLTFMEGITDEKKAKIIDYLHRHVGKKPGVDEMLYFRVLLDENIMAIPEYNDMVVEFPAYKNAYKNYNYYLGYSGVLRKNLSMKHTRKIDALSKEISKLIE